MTVSSGGASRGQQDVRGADLAGLKLSAMKMRSIAALADADLDVAHLDNDAVIAHVTRLPGIGRWTADWLLARCLGRRDVVAAGDLAVRKAVAAWFSGDPIWPEQRVREGDGPVRRAHESGRALHADARRGLKA